MAKANEDWKPFNHGPLETLAENVFRVEGSLPNMTLRRTMTVAKMSDGRVVIHSGIATDDATRTKIEALGKPSFLIVPNGFHRLDAPAYKKRYPELRVLCPHGARKKVEEVIAVDATTHDFPADDAVRFERIDGLNEVEDAMLVRSKDGTTLVLGDSVFNMDPKRDFLGNVITRVLGSAPGPRVSRLAKMVMVKDKRAFKACLERFASIPDLVRLIVAHEKVATGPEAAAALRTAATFV